jgi:hypothetical protein
MMAAITGEEGWVASREGSTGQPSSAPDEVEDGSVNGITPQGEGRTGSAEALKKAARAGVTDRWERIEDSCMYGCVDWYLYPEEPRDRLHP